jgi:hypothetical protein
MLSITHLPMLSWRPRNMSWNNELGAQWRPLSSELFRTAGPCRLQPLTKVRCLWAWPEPQGCNILAFENWLAVHGFFSGGEGVNECPCKIKPTDFLYGALLCRMDLELHGFPCVTHSELTLHRSLNRHPFIFWIRCFRHGSG